MTGIDHLIINKPYNVPTSYWYYDREKLTFIKKDGRRPAGYLIATPGTKAYEDPGYFHELPLVNKIRKRVDIWREKGYPGITSVTKRLLEYWNDPGARQYRFFFCQLEAIETIIFLL